MALVDYNIQKAVNTQENTILPIDRYEWAEGFKEVEQSVSSALKIASALNQRSGGGGGGGSSSAEQNALATAMSRDFGELAAINEQKPMSGAEIRMYSNAIWERYPTVSQSVKKQVADLHGFSMPSDAFTKVYAENAKRTAEEQLKLDNYYELIGRTALTPEASSNATRQQLIDMGKEAVENYSTFELNAEAISNPNTTSWQKNQAKAITANYIEVTMARAIDNLQNTLKRPLTLEELDELSNQIVTEMSSRGVNTSVAQVAVLEGSSPYRRIITDINKSNADKLKEIQNANAVNTAEWDREAYSRTGVPFERLNQMGAWLVFENNPAIIDNINKMLTANPRETSGVASQDAYEAAIRVAENSMSVTPGSSAAIFSQTVKPVTKEIDDIPQQDAAKYQDVSQINISKLIALLPAYAVKYKDMSPESQRVFNESAKQLAQTSLKNSLKIMSTVGEDIEWSVRDGKIELDKWTTRTFNSSAKNAVNTYNTNLNRLKQYLPHITEKEWNLWLQEAAEEVQASPLTSGRDLTDTDKIAGEENVRTYLGLQEEQQAIAGINENNFIRLPGAEATPIDYSDLTDIVEQGSVEQLKELKPTIMQNLLNNYMARVGQGYTVKTPLSSENVEKALVQKGVATEKEIESIQTVANMFRREQTGFYSSRVRGVPRKPDFNNPLNIKQSNQNWKGEKGTRNGFVIFNTPEDGIRAGAKLFDTYANKRNITTVKEFISRFSEDNREEYTEIVSNALGVSPDDKVDFTNPLIKARMIKAMIEVETPGRYNYSEEDIYKLITK